MREKRNRPVGRHGGESAPARHSDGADRRENTAARMEAQTREIVARQNRKKRIVSLSFTVLTALIVILLAVILRSVSDGHSFNNYMDQARTYYYSSDFNNALTYLRKAAGIEPTTECMAMIAQCYESQGNYDKALETLRKMDTGDKQVAEWIAELESRKDVIMESNLVTVAGKQYKGDTTGLALDSLGLGNNVLEEIQGLYSLNNLSLANNNIDDISGLTELGGLNTLNLSGNMISDISPLMSLTGLRTLYLDNNPVRDLSPLMKLSNLTTLSIKGIDITESQLKRLAEALPGCAIHSEDAEEELQDISFGGATFKADVTELDLSGMGIQNISALAGCKNLRRLNLSGNNISDLSPLMDIPNLQWLDVSGNSVADLRPLMGISSLRFLNVSGNMFSSVVPLGNITGLEELHISDNNIVNFSGLSKLKNLTTLGMANCNVTDEGLANLAYLTGLRSLNIEGNMNLSGEAVDMLQYSLMSCEIKHSELSYMVNIDGYSIANDSSYIDLSGLNITDIGNFAQFTNPETVNLSGNNISNLYVFQDAANRLLVKNLNISFNSVMDVTPVSYLKNLETLDVSYNMISSELPFLGLANLRELNVTGTMLNENQVRTLRDTLTGCNVISSFG
ncbi:MAG: leucine-rich repeat domain-containing protein [Candidatus Limivicinus sp.]|jgi:Leucine-rich repeat (LRR) protein